MGHLNKFTATKLWVLIQCIKLQSNTIFLLGTYYVQENHNTNFEPWFLFLQTLIFWPDAVFGVYNVKTTMKPPTVKEKFVQENLFFLSYYTVSGYYVLRFRHQSSTFRVIALINTLVIHNGTEGGFLDLCLFLLSLTYGSILVMDDLLFQPPWPSFPSAAYEGIPFRTFSQTTACDAH